MQPSTASPPAGALDAESTGIASLALDAGATESAEFAQEPPVSADAAPSSSASAAMETGARVDSAEFPDTVDEPGSSEPPALAAPISKFPEHFTRAAHKHQKYASEDTEDPKWKLHKKHIFILSSAGKPIYSRYGDEQSLAPFFGLLQALVSFVSDQKDSIRHVIAGPFKFVFVVRGPLYFVAVSQTDEPVAHLRLQLVYLHSQIVSILTHKVHSILAKQSSFDIRGLLGGTEATMGNLLHVMSTNASFFLECVRCVRLAPETRVEVGRALQTTRAPEAMFSILVSGFRLIHILRPRRQQLHTEDLLLVLNLVNSSSSFRTSDSFAPVCMPRFNDRGYVHVYVSFLADNVALILVTTKADAFHSLQQSREALVTDLTNRGLLHQITTAAAQPPVDMAEVERSTHANGVLRHFLYKAHGAGQFIAPAYGPPYVRRKEQKRLFQVYQNLYAMAYSPRYRSASVRPHQIVFHSTPSENIVVVTSPTFDLYAVFGPLTQRQHCIDVCNRILRWLKREEQSMLISSAPVW